MAPQSLTVADLLAARHVLCIQPHYDDNDLFAGGTIARLHDQGARVSYLTVTDDLVGVLDQSLSDAEMATQLEAEQHAAGAVIGVDDFYKLGYPDAGDYDYFRLRRDIIGYLRRLQPDWVLTVDPWLPYEAHQDHILTGRAVSEAVLLVEFTRLKTVPDIDDAYQPKPLTGVAYYLTAHPNALVDISSTTARKHQALRAYRAQFTPESLADLSRDLAEQEHAAAEGYGIAAAELLKLVRPAGLHGDTRTWRATLEHPSARERKATDF